MSRGRRTKCDQPALRMCGCATSSPSPDRAVRTSRRPELTLPRLPFAQCQSRTRHLAGIPRSTAARTAGQASRVDAKRPRILLEGISRSEYSTAPSMTMPKPSGDPGRFTSLAQVKSNSTRSRSASSSFVFTSFALRGAPCGDDAGQLHVAIGRYHDQATVPARQPDGQGARLVLRVEIVRNLNAPGVHVDALRFIEVDASLANVGVVLVGIPSVLDHAEDSSERRLSRPYPALLQSRRVHAPLVTPEVARPATTVATWTT